MAGSRIKGITVEIGGDTTKLQSALKGVNSEIKNTQSQLKDVEKLLKYDALQREIIETEEYLKSCKRRPISLPLLCRRLLLLVKT